MSGGAGREIWRPTFLEHLLDYERFVFGKDRARVHTAYTQTVEDKACPEDVISCVFECVLFFYAGI